MGEPDVRGMMRRMSFGQFWDWIEYFGVEAYGPPADYHRAGIIAAMIGNIHCPKDPPIFGEADWVPGQDKYEQPKMSTEQMQAVLSQLPTRRPHSGP